MKFPNALRARKTKQLWSRKIGPLAIRSILIPLALPLASPLASAQIALPESIETQSLRSDAFSTGALEAQEASLPRTLWQGSDAQTLSFLLDIAPARPAYPAIGEALRRTLLSASDGAADHLDRASRTKLGAQKLLALVEAGFVEEALAVASFSDSPRNDPDTGKALALAELVMKREPEACARGASINSTDEFWIRLRTFCYAYSGERDAADLTLGLLREQGRLTARQDDFLTAAVSGGGLKRPLEPRTALELAVARLLKQPLVPAVLQSANGSVLNGIANDTSVETTTRIRAGRRAMAMGFMRAQDFGALLASIPVTPEMVADAAGHIRRSPNAPLTDAIVWQAVSAMRAPEFLRDKASLIAQALSPVGSFNKQYARNRLYAADIASFEGAIIPSQDAGRFALSRMSVGDSEGAARWLFAMKGDQPLVSLGDDEAAIFIQLTSLLALLDPSAGQSVADAAQIALVDFSETTLIAGARGEAEDPYLPGRITDLVFDAALAGPQNNKVGHKQGQAALAAMALASIAQDRAHPVQAVVIERAMSIASMDDLRAQLKFQSAWRSVMPKISAIRRPVVADPDAGLSPSLKPSRRGR